jgi:rhomboid protease GluP
MAVVTDAMAPETAQLIRYGACRAVDVADGEPWRLLTYAFLHANLLHLGVNFYSLMVLGPLVERSIGSLRFLLLYVVGAIGGGVGGCLWHNPLAPLVGGSGALFAMLGAIVALLARGGRDPLEFTRQHAGKNVLGTIAVNLAFGLLIPVVSNAGHIGGLLAGFALTYWFLRPPRTPERGLRATQIAVAIAFAGATFAVLWPVTRFDRLLLQWEHTAPGARRDELREAFSLDDLGDPHALDDHNMAAQVATLARLRRGE